MLSGFKGKTGEQDRTTPASSDEPVGRTVQPVHSSVEFFILSSWINLKRSRNLYAKVLQFEFRCQPPRNPV